GVSFDVGYSDLRAGNSCSRRVKNNAGDASRPDLRRNVLRAEPTYQQAKPEQNVDAVSASDHSFTTRSGRDLGPIELKRCPSLTRLGRLVRLTPVPWAEHTSVPPLCTRLFF